MVTIIIPNKPTIIIPNKPSSGKRFPLLQKSRLAMAPTQPPI